jgi:hypothetical protein
MSYSRPFVTPTFTGYAGDSGTKNLSLAVSVIDTFTALPAAVKLYVLLKERPRLQAILSTSGAYCFEDIPNGNYTLVTEPDPVTADWFFLQPLPGNPWPTNFESAVTLPLAGAQPLRVWLAPNPSYPFPAGATLVRGLVTKANAAAAGAIVSTTYDQADPQDPQNNTIAVNVATKSDSEGQYVLFFRMLPDSTQAVQVVAQFGGQQIQHQVNILEGRTVTQPFAFP